MNYKQYNDYELIYMVRENDESVNDLLLEKYTPIVRKLVSNYYEKFKNYGFDYDDFYQEAMIAFYRAVSTYDETKNCLFYTYAILCVNRSLMSFSRDISTTKRNGLVFEFVDLDDCQISDLRSDINLISDFGELESLIKKTIFELPFECSVVLELKLNGFKYKEIGELLELPRSTAEFRCRKGLCILRQLFKEYYE